MLEIVKKEVYDFLKADESGHNDTHIKRVLDLSLKFSESENADKTIVSLIALLHDVDDYKLIDNESNGELVNAKRILNIAKVDSKTQEKVLSELNRIGYSKSLEGIRPLTIEGKIVSDADMCDASGVNGFIRCYKYNVKHGGVLFDKDIFPKLNMDANEYKKDKTHVAVNHLFEKILRLRGLMLTSSGRKEAEYRHQIIVDILYHLFEEENAKEWKEYLDNYLKRL